MTKARAVARGLGMPLMIEPLADANDQALRMLSDSSRWPFRLVQPLVHATRLDEFETPLCGVIASGHRARVFLARVEAFGPRDFDSLKRLNAALKPLESISYLSLSAVLNDGWRVD